MKKALPLILILIGTALLITAVVFWIDSNTSTEPQSFGKSLLDWITLIAGLGASIKGWMDLFKPDKPTLPTTKIDVKGDNSQISLGDNSPNIQTENYIGTQIVEPPEPKTPKSLNQLPAPPLDFVGREKELTQLRENIDKGVLISGVQGMGGIGKTTLGLKLAEQIASNYPNGQIYLDLRGAHEQTPLSPKQVMKHLILSFHPEAELPIDFGELTGLYRSVLNGKKVLLFYDNVLDENQLEELLPPKDCILFVTSRRLLTLPGLEAINLDMLTPVDAIRLVRQVAPRVSDKDADILASQCGYLPLAIRTATSALSLRPDWSPADLIRRLINNKARLGLVEGSLSLSYDLLGDDLQRYLRQLAVFTKHFGKSDVLAVWDVKNYSEADEIIGQLIKANFLSFDKRTMNYYFHDLINMFLEGKFLNDDRSNESLNRYAELFISLFREMLELLEFFESEIRYWLDNMPIENLTLRSLQDMTHEIQGKIRKIRRMDRQDIVAAGNKFYSKNSIQPPLSWKVYVAIQSETKNNVSKLQSKFKRRGSFSVRIPYTNYYKNIDHRLDRIMSWIDDVLEIILQIKTTCLENQVHPYRRDAFTQGQYYHIYNRRAGKAKIFLSDGNYQYLLRLVKEYYQKHGATIIAYCLMPNHYHFLLRQESDEPLSKFMQVLFNTYGRAWNLQQGRTGTLVEGRFKHKCVDKWEYLMILCRYIHRNPVKAGLVANPEDWAYSNYREWIGVRDGALVDKVFVQDHFSSAEEYVRFVNDAEDEKKSYEKIKKYMFD